mmetsp:Transcript_24675/g.38384  ORF Transcript_24675/g.38384 Transcript_24675/m.38384 type:complete len:89 (+) Transcript_24675:615-881(+)
MNAKRALKIITAVFSLWIPGLLGFVNQVNQESKNQSRKYSQILFGKLDQQRKKMMRSFASSFLSSSRSEKSTSTDNEKPVAEMVITTD